MNKLRSFLFGISRGEAILPELKTFLMREQREIEAGRRSSREGVVEDANLTIKCFKERISEYNHDSDDDETKDYFHPSQIGKCPRQLFFEAVGAPGPGAPTGEEMLKTHLIFEIGTYAHVMFQNLCARAGILARREIAVRDDKLKIIGHCDGELKLAADRLVLEFKTINARGFAKLDAAKTEHIWQATVYMALLGIKGAAIIYFNKDTSELREFRIGFDKTLWEKKILPKIVKHHEAVRTKQMPDRIENAQPGKFPCSYCAFNRLCYDSFELERFTKSLRAPKSRVAVKPTSKNATVRILKPKA